MSTTPKQAGTGSREREVDAAAVGPLEGDLERAIAAQVRACRVEAGASVGK